MTTVTLDQMKGKLLTEEQVLEKLHTTEPLTIDHISSDTKIKFSLAPDWAEGIDAVGAATPLDSVGMRVNGTERRMTKQAIFQAAGKFGLGASYIKKVPANLIEGLLNYHYSGGMGQTELSMFSVDGNISAFTRPTLQPFSNLQLTESVLEGIRRRHGSDLPIFADYKFHNDLQTTNVRFIVPTTDRIMEDTNMRDVPANETDTWLAGVHLFNSAVGKGQTTLESYMFRWWCTNGCTTEMGEVGKWSRRVNGQQDDVYGWARDTVDEILGGMEHRFDEVQGLARLHVAGNTGDILREIFARYQVPVSQRDTIMASLLDEPDNLTMYSIMQGITRTANEDDMEDGRRDRLMRIGGAIPTEQFDTLKARVWREGHTATEDVNPYEVRVTA
jgi:hypothetical protein